MKKRVSVVGVVTLTSFCLVTTAHVSHAIHGGIPLPMKERSVNYAVDHLRQPMTFEPNTGHFDPRFRFASHGLGYNVFLNSAGATLTLQPASESETPATLALKLEGGRQNAVLRGTQLLQGKVNYFYGRSENWITDIPTYSRIVAEDVYPGVDVEYYGKENRFEYDVIVHPGASPEAINIRFEGASVARVSADGDLIIAMGAREIRQLKPFVYQDVDGRRVSIAGKYVVENNLVRFSIGAYDRAKKLIIDPEVVYSSYFGSDNETHSITVDALGYIYISGDVWNGGLYTRDSRNAFVTKLTADGTVVWNSSFGNPAGDQTALDVKVDASGNVYTTGWTNGDSESPNSALRFPTVNPIEPTPVENLQAFVAKFDTGGNMVYSTTLGGGGIELGKGVALDFAGNIFVTGQTGSTDFPAVNAYQPLIRGGLDAFLLVLNPQGSRILYSTYIGGSDSDEANAIAIDKSGNVCIAGSTSSRDFPLQVPIQATPGASVNAFVMKFTSNLDAGLMPVFSTYLGGAGADAANALAVDAAGNLYVGGATSSANFPTAHAYQPNLSPHDPRRTEPPTDAFVAKIDPSGSTLVYSTYLGSENDDWVTGIVVNGAGNVFVIGSTASPNFPQVRSLQALKGTTDAFVAEFSPDGASLIYSTLLGGSTVQHAGVGLPWTIGVAIARDSVTSSVYITGITSTSDFPTTRASDCCLSSSSSPYFGKTSFLAKLADDALTTRALTRIEQNDPSVSYNGPWFVNRRSFHSGGSSATAMDPGSRAIFRFSGTAVKWIGYKDRWSGIAKVSVDGVLKTYVDTYSPVDRREATLFTAADLAPGSHTLTIEVTGTRDALSRGRWVWVDAFDVMR